MKAIFLTTLAMMAAVVLSCCRSDSNYEAQQAEFEREQVELAEEQAELEAEQEELRREYAEMKEEYLREKAKFQKERKALRKGVKKESRPNSLRRDTVARQLTENEVYKLTDKVKSAGLWPAGK